MGTGRVTITPSSITMEDGKGQARVKMGLWDDPPMARRARLYVHGKPEIRVETTDQNNWGEALTLRKAYGPGFAIYLWQETRDPTTEWRCMGEYGWRYATPPKEIALAQYLLEGQ